MELWSETTPHPKWDEEQYLSANPDVASSVAAGRLRSGWQHYLRHGLDESRPGVSLTEPPPIASRYCSDPWRYLEITPNMGLRPCCNYKELEHWEPGEGLDVKRSGEAFRALRASLVQGQMTSFCRKCHMQEMVTLDNLHPDCQSDAALPLTTLRIDISTACNLRCVYCAVSQPGYQGEHMPVESFDAIAELASRTDETCTIWLNGHGETTFHPQWTHLAKRLLGLRRQLYLTTNLAKRLNEEELDCLSRVSLIQVSLDSADSVLLKRVRKHVSLTTVLENINAIRQTAWQDGRESPAFDFSCVVYDLSAPGLPDLARLAVSFSAGITFWQLVSYSDVPGDTNVRPITDLSKAEISSAVEQLREACRIVRAAGLTATIEGHFDREWERVAGLIAHSQ